MNDLAASPSSFLRARISRREFSPPPAARPAIVDLPRGIGNWSGSFFFRWLLLLVFLGGLAGSSHGGEVRKGAAFVPVQASVIAPSTAASVAGPVFTGPPVKLRVANFTGRGVELVWLNPNGTHQTRGILPPMSAAGKPAQIDTFGGHLWLFKSEGRVLQFFAAGNQAVQDVQIGQPLAIPPAPSAEAATQVRLEGGMILQEPIPVPAVIVPPAPAELPAELKKAPEHAREFLRVHNEERARLGVPPLRWSAELARYAQKWAAHLARSGDFEHRSRSVARYGENLFRGETGYSPGDAARLWLEERAQYRGGPVEREDLGTMGHYTQMIWRDSTHVGFGVARGRDGLVIVANYSPGGNRSGQVPLQRYR